MRRFQRKKNFIPGARARERILAAWRGVNLAPLEQAQTSTARPLGQIVPGVLSEMRMDRRRSEAEIVKVWNSSIDPTITAHAQPTGIHKGTVFITVDSNAWLSEIVRYRRHEILDRLQHSFGSEMVRKISYRVG